MNTNTNQYDRSVARSIKDLRDSPLNVITSIYINEDLTEIPDIILERAPHVRVLDLSHNRLNSVPDWLVELRSLEIIFLSFNSFTHVPEILGRLPSLRMIGMRGNQIEHLSGAALPTALEWLTLTDNHIQALPTELGRTPKLRKLLLAGNRLASLPDTLRDAKGLELIRLSANRFDVFPDWLFQLPSLAWVAISGNPCTRSDRSEVTSANEISWKQLRLQEELGRGASGPTHRGILLHNEESHEEVAIKIFAREISSDGDTSDEMRAAIAAGQHPNLVSTRGVISRHPEGRQGLVLDLVPPSYSNLALPPSMASCTRDVYPSGARFTPAQVIELARCIAQAARHLHQRGILHGDLYAHNILFSDHHALLSDFGAACTYKDTHTLNHELVERTEVRAFGILLSELAERSAPGLSQRIADLVNSISAAARAPDVLGRPNFEQICKKIDAVARASVYT